MVICNIYLLVGYVLENYWFPKLKGSWDGSYLGIEKHIIVLDTTLLVALSFRGDIELIN